MISRKYSCIAVALLLLFSASPLFAQRKITIKLASLVPENTPWGAAINRMAAEWDKATNGEVEVIVYHNGAAGDEPEVLRKLRLNQLQAAVFTSLGLNSIMPEVMALSYPFLIRDNAELDAVMSKIKPELDNKIQQNGFVTLSWARAGWIRIFSKTPVFVPNDLRKIKMGTASDDLQMLQAFRAMGYQMVPINLPEIMVFLNGGMIDSIYLSPIFAAGNQVFGVAKNMTGINVSPFMGGILMNNTAWRRIPDKYKPQLIAINNRLEREIETSISNLEAEAISTMVKYGLTINQPDARQLQEWYDDTAKYENSLVISGNIFNREYYQKINTILTEYRRGR
ncbi:MAG: TRAP transporter substrate-binding protein DctP [Treponema sp.]|jgi:TRAP-type C4-dicarboxylate transport system substrate-binding protein|nr:TRAP transporter substrate-binding protein DctP [Treponema sp.]